jgi:hypothetical protein
LTLSGGPHDFTGPPPGNKFPLTGRADDCEEYFRRFWGDDVLERIVNETNM